MKKAASRMKSRDLKNSQIIKTMPDFGRRVAVSHEEILRTGGAEFYAEITNNNELRGWMYVQQQRTERFC